MLLLLLQVVAFSRPLAISFVVLARSWFCAAWMLQPSDCRQVAKFLLPTWQLISANQMHNTRRDRETWRLWHVLVLHATCTCAYPTWLALSDLANHCFLRWFSGRILPISLACCICCLDFQIQTSCFSQCVIGSTPTSGCWFNRLWLLGLAICGSWASYITSGLDPERPPDGGVFRYDPPVVRMGRSPWKRIHLAKSEA